MKYFALLHRLAMEQNQAKQFCIIRLSSDASLSLVRKKLTCAYSRNGLMRPLCLLKTHIRDSSSNKTKDKVSSIFLLLNSVPEEKAARFWDKRHETHSRKRRGRKKVKEESVRRTTPGRRKAARQPGGEGPSLQLTGCSAQQHWEQEERQSWNQQ